MSQNRYTYANNNPVNNIDPTGHYSQGVNKYYQSTGLNELRDQMTAAAFHAGEVEAQNAFNRQVARAQNTSMFKYNSINGISQDTANAYIANGIVKAAETSINYGCETPTLSAEAVATYVVTVQNAKTTANQKISNIKQNKQAQYRAYMEYQRELQRQREAAAAEEVRRKMQKMMAVVSSGLAGVTKTLETLNGVRTSNGGNNHSMYNPLYMSITNDAYLDNSYYIVDYDTPLFGSVTDVTSTYFDQKIPLFNWTNMIEFENKKSLVVSSGEAKILSSDANSIVNVSDGSFSHGWGNTFFERIGYDWHIGRSGDDNLSLGTQLEFEFIEDISIYISGDVTLFEETTFSLGYTTTVENVENDASININVDTTAAILGIVAGLFGGGVFSTSGAGAETFGNGWRVFPIN